MDRWYLVHTKPSRERQVAVHLNQRGLSVYLPLIWVSPANPRTSRERPYFPGHLFAMLDLKSIGVDVIRWSPGARGLVELGGEPVFVSNDFMAVLQQGLTRLPAISAMAPDGTRSADFAPISQGPFKGYEGIFNPRVLGADRTRILLACIAQEFWCMRTQVRPDAEMTDNSIVPNSDR